MTWRIAGVWFLTTQAVGGAAWWAVLLAWPASARVVPPARRRGCDPAGLRPGRPRPVRGAVGRLRPGTARRRSWAWPALLVHVGAAAYAALYCWTLTALTGDALAGAVLMTPSLVLPGLLAWQLRPTGDRSC